MTLHKPRTNKHMIHVEDKMFYGGFDGAVEAFSSLYMVNHMLRGCDVAPFKVMTKWDGSPSVFVGTDPSDGRFFVSTKSILNKRRPIVFKSIDELEQAFKGDLLAKMIAVYTHLAPQHPYQWTDIIQGDLMFTRDDLSTRLIDGCVYHTFQPNTLVYAAARDSRLGEAIRGDRTDLGIVWHTTYKGPSLADLTASYGVQLPQNESTPYVWHHDPTIQFKHFYSFDQHTLNHIMEQITDKMMGVPAYILDDIANTPEAPDLVELVVNSIIKRGEEIVPSQLAEAIRVEAGWQWLTSMSQLKTDAAQERAGARYDRLMEVFSPKRDTMLNAAFEAYVLMQDAKAILINTLNRYQSIDTFVKTPAGYMRTGAEGFVVVAQDGHACKLVDRAEFSFNNFSADVQKGWNKTPRG